MDPLLFGTGTKDASGVHFRRISELSVKSPGWTIHAVLPSQGRRARCFGTQGQKGTRQRSSIMAWADMFWPAAAAALLWAREMAPSGFMTNERGHFGDRWADT